MKVSLVRGDRRLYAFGGRVGVGSSGGPPHIEGLVIGNHIRVSTFSWVHNSPFEDPRHAF